MALSRLRRFSVTYLPRQIYNLAFTKNKLKTIRLSRMAQSKQKAKRFSMPYKTYKNRCEEDFCFLAKMTEN